MSRFNEFAKKNGETKEDVRKGTKIEVSFLCSVCNEHVTTAYVMHHEQQPRTEWTCSEGHVSSMKWMP
jgi:hypothetical protein